MNKKYFLGMLCLAFVLMASHLQAQLQLDVEGDGTISGKLGIGTTTPFTKLHIEGGTDVTATGSNGYIMLGNATGINMGIDDNEIQARDNGAASTLFFQSEGGNTILNANGGNVGIGTTTPDSKLLLANFGANDGLKMLGFGELETSTFWFGSGFAPTGGDNYMSLSTTSVTDAMSWKLNGNVGIGTTTPFTKLHIEGGTDVTTGANGYLILGSTTGLNIGIDDNEIQARDNGGTSPLSLQNEGGNTHINANGGSVGIGTTTPDQTFHVHKGSAGDVSANGNSIAVFENNTNGYLNILTPNQVESAILFGQPTLGNAAGGILFDSNFADGLEFRTGGNLAHQIGITADGDMGIGTTTPAEKLHVIGNVEATSFIGDGSQLTGISGGSSLWTEGTHGIYRNTGNVGIGTLPEEFYKLAVGSNMIMNNGGGVFFNDTNFSGYIKPLGDNMVINATAPNDGILISTANTARMWITSAGKVGIGTSTVPSAYLMAIDGKLICENVRVQLSGDWPDFVFEKDYELPSLKEVERFIQEEKHLPGIPSAKEIDAEGIDVALMNNKLLQKIEELMLYTIEQQKSIEAQQKQIDHLKSLLTQSKK